MEHKRADSIFFNGDIITVSEIRPLVEAVAVKDGRILAVGTSEDLSLLKGPSTEMVNLKGHTMMPGFIEPHTHPIMASIQNRYFVDVSGFTHRTSASVYDALKKAVANTSKGQWIRAYGLDPLLVPDLVAPSVSDLDAIAPDNPLFIIAQNGHTAYCNSIAFKLAGVTKDTPNPPGGGSFVKDSEGNLTGMLTETPAIKSIDKVAPRVGTELGTKLLKNQLIEYGRHGFTTIAALGLFPMFVHAFQVAQDLVEAPTSPVRLVVYMKEDLMRKRKLEETKQGIPGKDSFCKVGVKWWGDGSPYTGTMATAEPYLDTPFTREALKFPPHPWCGELNYTTEELYESMKPYHTQGWQLAIHTHGERAISQALDVFERLLKEYPRQHRHRLEHCGLITQQLLARSKALGVALSFFLDHVYFYGHRLCNDVLGPSRASRWTPLQSATRLGHCWSLHSDTPCSPLGPFRVMKTAVTRETREPCRLVPASGDCSNPYGNHGVNDQEPVQTPSPTQLGPDECVSVDEVIKAYTINAAWQIYHEDVIGSIEVGKIADFVVVDKNPRKISSNELDSIKVMETYRNGKKVENKQTKL